MHAEGPPCFHGAAVGLEEAVITKADEMFQSRAAHAVRNVQIHHDGTLVAVICRRFPVWVFWRMLAVALELHYNVLSAFANTGLKCGYRAVDDLTPASVRRRVPVRRGLKHLFGRPSGPGQR